MTYDELIALCREGDPLICENDKYEVTDEGLVIFGCDDDTEWKMDCRIEILESGEFRTWVRDPETDEKYFGREWCNEITLPTYEKLVTWLYGF